MPSFTAIECLNRRTIVHRDLGRLVHNTTLTLASRAERQRRVLTSVAEDHSQFNVPAFSNDAEHKSIDSSLLSMIKATKENIKIKILNQLNQSVHVGRTDWLEADPQCGFPFP